MMIPGGPQFLQEGFGDQEFMGKIVIKTKPNRKAWGNNKGQNLVEFALVVPLLLLLVIGIAEFGRAWMTKNILTGAAREAVRLLAVPPPTGVDNAAWNAAITA